MKKVRYDIYDMSISEYIKHISTALLIIAAIAYLFYRSVIAFLIFLPFVFFYIKRKKKELLKKSQKELTFQFKEAIMAVSASLGAGYSVENAFIEAAKDLKNLYGQDAVIVHEFSGIRRRLATNETMESILIDFAKRSGAMDVMDFADVFVTAKRSGGDLVSIIRRTAYHIGDKIEVKREIDTLMSSKKMEQSIMNMVPFFIILYVSLNSPGFLDVLYGNVMGVVIMSICLVLYLAAYQIADKIVSIEV